jgi:hypothetical protein
MINHVLKLQRERLRREQESAHVNGVMQDIGRGQRVRVLGKIAKALLLSSPVFWNGVRISINAKSVGCGVYEVWGEQEKGGG